HERRGGMVLPDVQMVALEYGPFGGLVLGFPRHLTKPFKIGVAICETGIDGVPQGFVLPIGITGSLEQNGERGWVIDLSPRHLPRIVDYVEGEIFLSGSRRGGDDGEG